ALCAQVMQDIIRPTVAALAADGMPYVGVLYAGLMITASGPKLIEYNVRFGDPECQVLMMRLRSDLLELLLAACDGGLHAARAEWRDEAALTVVMANDGYPGDHAKGDVISGLDAASRHDGVEVFHAGTAARNGAIIATGGRVLNVTALGASVAQAQTRAYRAVDAIHWPHAYCRRDIGWRAVAREKKAADMKKS
ncbi:MAG: phosphoribosylamine--glycine ligase, partial [Alphaproteobacteria bacterium]